METLIALEDSWLTLLQNHASARKTQTCLNACPVDAIHPGANEAGAATATQLYINPDDCICCGACVPVCPVGAIYAEEDLPEKWKHYIQINRDWYMAPNISNL